MAEFDPVLTFYRQAGAGKAYPVVDAHEHTEVDRAGPGGR